MTDTTSFGRLSPNDPSSYSRPDLVKVIHLDLHWDLNFDEQIISGCVTLVIEKVDPNANELILDSNDLEIFSVVLRNRDKDDLPLSYTVGEKIEDIGQKLAITLPEGSIKNHYVKIDYATNKKAAGLQWLSPAQTGTKKHPFLFSQFQSILARSAVPCQDTPSLKATYSAEVISPPHIEVRMSAKRDDKIIQSDGVLIFKFSQRHAIPAYLIAIAAGDLEERQIGPRSSVWAEKDVVDKAAYEFANVEKMLQTAEFFCGKYIWGIYDMLILPPSFPYGGMENPNLTFVTPTILAGDRSLVDVIIHEISHSWTGNLVTNYNWEHFWLNEGFTMFIERKIIGRMHGAKARHLDAACGWKSLVECVKTLGETNPSTCLVADLTGIDPEANYTSIPYEKGHAFLWYLETLIGEEEMDMFLRLYLLHFSPYTVNSTEFKDYFINYFSHRKDILDVIDWDAWWYKPGMPPIELKFDTSLIDCCSNLLQKWIDWGVNSDCEFSKDDLQEFSTNQLILWMKMLAEQAALPIEKLKKIDEVYGLSGYNNNEIKFFWIKIGLQSRWQKVVQPAFDFINEQGRMKYVAPIYREMYKWAEVRPLAIANFEEKRSTMMHCSVQKLTKELHIS